MEWKSLAGAVGLIAALSAGNTWIVSALIEAAVSRQAAVSKTMDSKLDRVIDQYIRLTEEVSQVRAQQRVEHVLRVCAQRPEVCDD